jgi:hypothetical protein
VTTSLGAFLSYRDDGAGEDATLPRRGTTVG